MLRFVSEDMHGICQLLIIGDARSDVANAQLLMLSDASEVPFVIEPPAIVDPVT